jgi:hypothetical protein
MKRFFLLIALFSSYQSNSQVLVPKNAGDANKSPIAVTYYGFHSPKSDDLDFVPQYQPIISKNESVNNEALEVIKRAKMLIKKQYSIDHLNLVNKPTRIDGPVTPILEVGYNAINSQGTPPDNSVAVNKNNQIVACVNSTLRYYNATSGAALAASISFSSFFQPMSNPSLATNDICDPKVIFDQQSNRFIVFAQTCEGNSSTSQILVACSKTDNPTQGWHLYGFSGNQSTALGQNGWFDYPKIAVSDHDLFVTGNIFSNGGNYIQSIIFQIDKTKCYAGNALGASDATIWFNIDNNPFTMVPMSNGKSGGYGNNMFLVSTVNSSFGGTALNIYEINTSVQNNPTLTAQQIAVNDNSYPANAIQKGSTVELQSGDNRGLDGFYYNGKIHYVFHGDVGNGYAGVIYYRLQKNGSTWEVDKQQTIKATGKDYTYPSICSMGYDNDVNDQAALIGFSYASANEYPGMKAVFINKEGIQSPSIEIKTGIGYTDTQKQPIYDQNGNIIGYETRWGDYSSMSRVQNATKPTAWYFSCFGNTFHNWTNHFAKITTAAWPLGIAEMEKAESEVIVYPNPVIENIVQVKLNIEDIGRLVVNLMDMNGNFIREIYQTNTAKGENLFSFNASPLANGNYIVSFNLNNQLIKNEKITITNQ